MTRLEKWGMGLLISGLLMIATPMMICVAIIAWKECFRLLGF